MDTVTLKTFYRCFRKEHVNQLLQAYFQPIDRRRYTNAYFNIAYGNRSKFQKIDIYLPEKGEEPFPVIVYVHGGAWIGGGKRFSCMLPPLSFLQKGYAVVGVNYRLSPFYKWPAHIHDVKAVVRFLKGNADTYHLDASRIVLWGDSAGGHLVELIALTQNNEDLEDLSMGYPEQDTRIKAAISWFGISNFAAFENESLALSLGSKILPRFIYKLFPYLIFKQNVFQDIALAKQASPINYVSTAHNIAPLLLQHGSDDVLVSTAQSISLRNKLVETFGPESCELDIIEGAGHYSKEFVVPENMSRIQSFIEKNLSRSISE